jgi:AAA15 family ATPase/GTPase
VQGKPIITRNASRDFLKYILSLDYKLYGAKANKNEKFEKNLEEWFDRFRQALREIYDCPELETRRDTEAFVFKIEMPGYEPFTLNEMSDGYAAFLNIYMELLMRLEGDGAVVEYNTPAIVLIDEIETHLHVELQKRVLPFLTKMFPNIQFIVATHSPFVITSLENAVVFDLEKKEQLENPSIYSYEAVVEGYLDVGQYSNGIKNKFNRYKELYGKELSGAETIEFQQLVSDLELVPPASKELYLAFRTMEDKRKA